MVKYLTYSKMNLRVPVCCFCVVTKLSTYQYVWKVNDEERNSLDFEILGLLFQYKFLKVCILIITIL